MVSDSKDFHAKPCCAVNELLRSIRTIGSCGMAVKVYRIIRQISG